MSDTASGERRDPDDWQDGDCECEDAINCPVHSPLAWLREWWRLRRGAARFTSPEKAKIDVALAALVGEPGEVVVWAWHVESGGQRFCVLTEKLAHEWRGRRARVTPLYVHPKGDSTR